MYYILVDLRKQHSLHFEGERLYIKDRELTTETGAVVESTPALLSWLKNARHGTAFTVDSNTSIAALDPSQCR